MPIPNRRRSWRDRFNDSRGTFIRFKTPGVSRLLRSGWPAGRDFLNRRFDLLHPKKPMNDQNEKNIALLALVVAVLLFLAVAMSGCAHRPTSVSVVSTAALSGHLDQINGDLSAADGKAVIVEQWLKTHP